MQVNANDLYCLKRDWFDWRIEMKLRVEYVMVENFRDE